MTFKNKIKDSSLQCAVSSVATGGAVRFSISLLSLS